MCGLMWKCSDCIAVLRQTASTDLVSRKKEETKHDIAHKRMIKRNLSKSECATLHEYFTHFHRLIKIK